MTKKKCIKLMMSASRSGDRRDAEAMFKAVKNDHPGSSNAVVLHMVLNKAWCFMIEQENAATACSITDIDTALRARSKRKHDRLMGGK